MGVISSTAQCSWIDDVEAEQGWTHEFHSVSVFLDHQIGDALDGWMAKQNCSCLGIQRMAHAPSRTAAPV